MAGRASVTVPRRRSPVPARCVVDRSLLGRVAVRVAVSGTRLPTHPQHQLGNVRPAELSARHTLDLRGSSWLAFAALGRFRTRPRMSCRNATCSPPASRCGSTRPTTLPWWHPNSGDGSPPQAARVSDALPARPPAECVSAVDLDNPWSNLQRELSVPILAISSTTWVSSQRRTRPSTPVP
jgi:hypothetical protein